jgi:hypothetical protein
MSNGTLVRAREAAVERTVTAVVSSLLVLVPPWAALPAGWVIGCLTHLAFASPRILPWATAGLTAATIGLSAMTWALTHDRGRWGRWHGTLTTAAAGLWLITATVVGGVAAVATFPFTPFIPIAAATWALTWNLRQVIRVSDADPRGDRLRDLFAPHAQTVGLPGTTLRTTKVEPNRISAQMALAGGKTADDAVKAAPAMESAMGLPPGSVLPTVNEDRADRADVAITDPRLLKTPIPWPGPSLPGDTIAKPGRPGLWQDGQPVQYCIVGHHLQISGTTGSGKSFGGAWNLLGEIITRHDAAVFGVDITKGDGTLGPMREALHRLETTPKGARAMLSEVLAEVKPRQNYLTRKGLKKWEEGCGLTYWVVWLEECPDIIDVLDVETLIKLLRIARSAGISIVFSLQVATWDQIPTPLRKLLYKMCFGLTDPDDREYTLTPAQYKNKAARPELWMADHPGMALLHAPSIPTDRIAMPLRTYDWGNDTTLMTAHAAAFPAAAKQVCSFTRKITNAATTAAAPATDPATNPSPPNDPAPTTPPPDGAEPDGAVPDAPAPPAPAAPGEDHDDENHEEEDREDPPWDVSGVHDELRIPDPNPANQAGLDDPLPPADDDGITFGHDTPGKASPQQARKLLYTQIATWHRQGREKFRIADLAHVWQQAGFSRQWAHKWVKALCESGHLQHDEEGAGYFIVRAPDPEAPNDDD